jgi:hypothetical protein
MMKWNLCKSAADLQSAEKQLAFWLIPADGKSAALCFAEIAIYEHKSSINS